MSAPRPSHPAAAFDSACYSCAEPTVLGRDADGRPGFFCAAGDCDARGVRQLPAQIGEQAAPTDGERRA